ncbi:MAG TPA: IPTL-CTERM sorting domain-containing protein [Pseudorhodoferax sp.]|nr:IPTL-CTERM sorting domain-containing protein [Pseudorhodoferax sp.]
MPLKLSRFVPAILLAFTTANAAHAAQQCFALNGNAPTVYGGVTVTVTGTCASNAAQQGPFAPGEAQLYTSGSAACTYAFSKPLLASTIRVQVEALQDAAGVQLATGAGPYQPVAADITSPLAGSTAVNPISINGLNFRGTAAPFSSGTLALTNSATAGTSSLSVTYLGAGSTWLKVCADDAGVPAVAIQQVPTLSQWGVLLTSGLLAAFALFAFSRTQRAGGRRAP